MGDVADILGFAKKDVLSTSDEALRIFSEKGKAGNVKGVKKPKGMSREVFDLVGSETLVPAMQPNNVIPSFKNKRSTALKGKWIWDQIKSSARDDQSLKLFHWVKADMHYSDYPYAKFNVKLNGVYFTIDEYKQYSLDSPDWTYEDTVAVMHTSIRYDLRWPVVYDRLALSIPKKMEEIQARYFEVNYILQQARHETDNGVLNKPAFNMESEMNRRQQQDVLFRKTKGDEAEECRLREELKAIDLALKKHKKQAAMAAAATAAANAAAAKAALKAAGVEAAEAAAVPVIIIGSAINPTQIASESQLQPVRGKPCLQSSRLYSTDIGAGVSKNLFRKMGSYLAEVGLPDRPMPTRAVCDLVDQIRLDTVTLLSLHNAIGRKEKPPGHSSSAVSSAVVKAEKPVKVKATEKTADGEPKVKKAGVKRKNAGEVDAAGNLIVTEQKVAKKQSVKKEVVKL